MKFKDKLFLTFIYAPVIPIVLFLLGWWGGLLIIKDITVLVFGFSGLTIGTLIDFLLYKKWIRKGYDINQFLLMAVYVFYSICFFGFFMGVPVFNIFLGIPAGIFIARKIIQNKHNNTKILIKKTSIFTSTIMFFICLASAYIALNDPYTIANLEGMFNLSFDLTPSMLHVGILTGGILLIISEYLITKATMLFLIKRENNRSSK